MGAPKLSDLGVDVFEAAPAQLCERRDVADQGRRAGATTPRISPDQVTDPTVLARFDEMRSLVKASGLVL